MNRCTHSLCAALALLGGSLSRVNLATADDSSLDRPAASPTVLGVCEDRFTLNGTPTFLLGFSYYGALGAPEEFLRRDLDDARRHGFNWLRVWATWDAFDHDVSAVGADGRAREPFLGKLRWLVAECDRRGLVVDVTLTRGKGTPDAASGGRLPDFEAHQRAVETLVTALKPHRNWYLDLANERDVRDERHVPPGELKALLELVCRLDPTRLVTASFGGHDLSEQDVREALLVIGLDFLSPHRPRSAESPGQTEAKTRECLDLMRRIGRIAPVHHQEPFRRGYGSWEPVAGDFLTDLHGAVAGGAAGWCFHNGSQRNTPGQEPRRSFDLRAKRLFDQLDAEEQKVVREAAAQLRPARGINPVPGLSGIEPGAAHGWISNGGFGVSNRVLSAAWNISESGLRGGFFRDQQTGRSLTLTGELFQVVLKDGTCYRASELRFGGAPGIVEREPQPAASRLAERMPGKKIEVRLTAADGRLGVTWRALALDDANYIRQEIDVAALKEDLRLREVVWLQQPVPEATTAGSVDGSPVIAGPFFLGCEDPMALNQVGSEREVICRLPREATLRQGETLTISFVLGVAPAGQMRRAFLGYLERERAHPYRPYLHYNSWYDTAWDPFALNETNCLEAIRLCGDRLIQPHGVVMDGMVFDDGWDDPKTLWQFHRGFPNGFAPLAELCRQYHTRLGVWLSPFGGYGEPKDQRIKFGREQGFETNATGFSLAGPKYYAAFKQSCVNMIRQFGVNHFKFDGIATGMYASGGAEYIRDTEAMRRLMLELRQEDPNLYLNLTTGSWPSPFWLRYADSVWRQGGDMGHAGKGPRQQQWLTYRDQEVYRNVVRKGPLYPLNSLMTQGVAYSRHGLAGDPSFNSAGFQDDVRAFFGSGTGLQELYIQPGKLTADDWRVLAEAAKWSRANSDVLVDTHWIGGDPGKLEVYGYASWSARQGIVMLRNPDDRPHEFALDVGTVFELPAGAATKFKLTNPWAEDARKPALPAESGRPLRLELKPFGIVVLDAVPSP